jgi:hypothetical protein
MKQSVAIRIYRSRAFTTDKLLTSMTKTPRTTSKPGLGVPRNANIFLCSITSLLTKVLAMESIALPPSHPRQEKRAFMVLERNQCQS